MKIRKKTAVLKLSDPITVLSSLSNFQTFRDSNNIHKDAAQWLVPYFARGPVKEALFYKVNDDKTSLRQEGRLTTRCQVVSYF